MSNITTVQKHGTNEKYLRTVIPQTIVKQLGLKTGDAFLWKTDSITKITLTKINQNI